MSKYHIDTTRITTINGIEYKADITRDVTIDFSEAKYTVKMWEDVHDAEIELIPDNMEFLHEVTDIFPISEYDIKIIQSLYRHIKPHVSLYLDIRNKVTGEKVFFADSALLSDKDHDYIRDILVREVPQYEWRTAEKYLRSNIEQYLGENRLDDLLTDDAFNFFGRMVSARWKDMKTKGFIDFEAGSMISVARSILEEALRGAYELEENGDEQPEDA